MAYKNPFPGLTIINKSRKDRCQEIRTKEGKSVNANVGASLMSKPL